MNSKGQLKAIGHVVQNHVCPFFSLKRDSESLYYFKYSFPNRQDTEWNSSLLSVICESSLKSFKVSLLSYLRSKWYQ